MISQVSQVFNFILARAFLFSVVVASTRLRIFIRIIDVSPLGVTVSWEGLISIFYFPYYESSLSFAGLGPAGGWSGRGVSFILV